jgi:hypothetical protein
MEFLLLESHTAKTILNPNAEIRIITVDGLLAVKAVIAIIRILTIHTAITEFALVAQGAVHAIRAVKKPMIVVAIIRAKTRKSHVAIPTFFGVLAKRTVFIAHGLQSHVRSLVSKLLELFKIGHGLF